MISEYQIAVIFWGSAGAFGTVLAVLGGMLDATWRTACRRAHEGAVRSRARRVRVTPLPRPEILEVHTLYGNR